MKNKEWYENIPDQGVLCKTSSGNLVNIIGTYQNGDDKSKCGAMFPVDWLTPLSPQQWWQFAPWNYDMDAVYLDENILIKFDDMSVYSCLYGSNGIIYYSHSNRRKIGSAIAWLPLPDNK